MEARIPRRPLLASLLALSPLMLPGMAKNPLPLLSILHYPIEGLPPIANAPCHITCDCCPGTAVAGGVVDAIKEADPTVPTAKPPRIGDAIESVCHRGSLELLQQFSVIKVLMRTLSRRMA
jgi:hypothetical protein